MEPIEIEQRARDSTQQLIETIRSTWGVELTVGAHSLAWLDKHIDENRATAAGMKNLLGYFLGECLVSLGGRWAWVENQPAVELAVPGGNDGQLIAAYPFTRVEKHVERGSDHSILAFFAQLGEMTERRARPTREIPLCQDGIERILHRKLVGKHAAIRGQDNGAWHVEHDDPEHPGARLAFTFGFARDDAGMHLHSDAPVDTYTPQQAKRHAGFLRAVGAAVVHERVGFDTFDDVMMFVGAQHGAARIDDGIYEIDGGDDNAPISLRAGDVLGEPWVWLGAYLGEPEELDAGWLLAQSGTSVHLDIETIADGVFVSTAFPIRLLTGQRLLELIDDVRDEHAVLTEEITARR